MGPFAPGTMQTSPVQQLMALTPGGHDASADVMIVTNHAVWTHLDALSHQAIDGLVYPGRPFADSATPAGVTHGSTTAFAAGVVTRGVLLDLAAEPGPVAAATHGGVTVDLLRTLLGEGVMARELLHVGVPSCAVTTVHDLDVIKIASVAHLWGPL